MPEVTFKQLSLTEWDAKRDPFDLHIRLIDQIVYRLNGLTPNEIKLVEGVAK